MSNSYGFDFLQAQHKLDADGNPLSDSQHLEHQHLIGGISQDELTAIQSAVDNKNKPDLEKQFIILAFLRAHPGSGCLAPDIIYRATGIDLTIDVKVAEMLKENPKVRVELVPDPENPSLTVATYAYQAKYSSVRNATTLLAQINRMTSGVPMRDLLDSYPGVEEDLKALITAGDCIAVYNSEDKDKILFPRGEAFLVELDGLVALPKNVTVALKEREKQEKKMEERRKRKLEEEQDNEADKTIQDEEEGPRKEEEKEIMPPPVKIPECYVVDTDVNPKNQIRRGEAICVGGQWFRLSSAVKAGVPLHEQPARAQAPLSVVSLQDLSKRNEIDGYIRPFSETKLPLDAALSETAIQNIANARKAKDNLLKLSHGSRGSGAGGSGGGVTAQLTGSYAHASNPMTLAASFATSTMTNMNLRNKRPTSKSASGNPNEPASGATSGPVLSKEVLEKAAANTDLALYSHARRHGCTRDVREMYLATRSVVPESDHDLHQALLEHKLLEPNEQMRRPRLAKQGANVDNDGKPKKRRYYERKNQRMTNTHLEGTEIGAILARAAEKQKQGKSVGDGGM